MSSAHSSSEPATGAHDAGIDDVGIDDAGFTDVVLAIAATIPAGRVATYGDIAALLGSRGARAVGGVMSRHGSSVPWWRVIRAGGHPPDCHEHSALEHYERERTPLLPSATAAGYRVDIASCRWPD